MNANWIDLSISGFFIYGSIIGFKRGLIKEIASLFGLIVGLTSVYSFSDQLSSLIQVFLNISSAFAYIASCFIIFLIATYVVSYLAHLITKALKIVALGFINRITGLIFGLLKWVVIISGLIFFLNKIFFFNEISEQFKSADMKSSVLYEPLSEIGKLLVKVIKNKQEKDEWKYL